MVNFEVINELCLRVTCRGIDHIFSKAGAFIGGECMGERNYKFNKVLLGPEENVGRAILGQLARRVTRENIPLMKVEFSGDSVTYYANQQQHVVVYQLNPGESLFVESDNLLAFSNECNYSVRFMGVGIISQKGLVTTKLTGNGDHSFVAVLCDGNPLVLSNVMSRSTLVADPDAVVCWTEYDPEIKFDISWRNIIGQHSGETYMFEWNGNKPTTVLIQPEEREIHSNNTNKRASSDANNSQYNTGVTGVPLPVNTNGQGMNVGQVINAAGMPMNNNGYPMNNNGYMNGSGYPPNNNGGFM